MRRSDSRILTTHVGSLPRDPVLSDLLIRQERGEAIDRGALDKAIARAVDAVVAGQIDAGIHIINDGEQPRVGFQTYVPQRMQGFGGASRRARPADYLAFPEFARRAVTRFGARSKVADAPMAVGEVVYQDLAPAAAECDAFDRATAAYEGRFVERFMTAASPGIVATTMLNAHYDSHEAYVFALARELAKEYRLIVDRGNVLQIDAPDLAMERTMMFQDKPLSEFLSAVEIHVAALNAALEGIPADRVRLHCCWGNWEGPHVHDVPLADILPLILRARVGGLSPRIRQSAAPARIRGVEALCAAGRHAASAGRDRFHDQLRRAPGSGGEPDLGGGRRRRRPRAGDRKLRLRLRHLHRLRVRGARRGLGEAPRPERGRGDCKPPSVGLRPAQHSPQRSPFVSIIRLVGGSSSASMAFIVSWNAGSFGEVAGPP